MSLNTPTVLAKQTPRSTLDGLKSGDYLTYSINNLHSVMVQMDADETAGAWGAAVVTMTLSVNGNVFYANPHAAVTYGASGLKFSKVAGAIEMRLTVTTPNATALPITVSVTGTNESAT